MRTGRQSTCAWPEVWPAWRSGVQGARWARAPRIGQGLHTARHAAGRHREAAQRGGHLVQPAPEPGLSRRCHCCPARPAARSRGRALAEATAWWLPARRPSVMMTPPSSSTNSSCTPRLRSSAAMACAPARTAQVVAKAQVPARMTRRQRAHHVCAYYVPMSGFPSASSALTPRRLEALTVRPALLLVMSHRKVDGALGLEAAGGRGSAAGGAPAFMQRAAAAAAAMASPHVRSAAGLLPSLPCSTTSAAAAAAARAGDGMDAAKQRRRRGTCHRRALGFTVLSAAGSSPSQPPRPQPTPGRAAVTAPPAAAAG